MMSRLLVVLVMVIAAFVAVDVNTHGSFKGSTTDLILKDPQKYLTIAFSNFRTYSQQAYRWSKRNVPVYLRQGREGLLLFLLWLRDLLISLTVTLWHNIRQLYQYLVDNRPAFTNWVDGKVPGLRDMVSRWWSVVCEYTVKLAHLLLAYLSAVARWLRDNVFVRVTLESLQELTMKALNTTRTVASQTLAWVSGSLSVSPSAS